MNRRASILKRLVLALGLALALFAAPALADGDLVIQMPRVYPEGMGYASYDEINGVLQAQVEEGCCFTGWRYAAS